MQRLFGVLFLMCCLTVVHLGFAAQAQTDQRSPSLKEAVCLLETWIESVVDFDRLPGLSIAVVQDQELVYTKGFGYADADAQTKATPNTIYSICSISKLFTSIALMQLRDAGKLELDDPVYKYLPWFAPENSPPELRAVTLRAILRHSGGLPCAPDLTVWPDPDMSFPTQKELLERVSRLKLSHPPDTSFNYSNLGYSLLGQVISTVSGLDYADYVQQHIIGPLRLEATTPVLPQGRAGREMATGYGLWPRMGSRKEVTNYDVRTLAPAMGFCSTVSDMAKFAMWQFRVIDGSDDRVLSQTALSEMYNVEWSNPTWGLGFTIWQMDDKTFVGHQGGCPGYKSQFILCPEDKIAVVVMINATDAPQFTLVFRAYEIMAPALKARREDNETSSEWSRHAGYYTGETSWSDAEVLEWEGELAVLWIPTPNPVGSLVKLRRVEGEVFRQVQSDGAPGKHYVFKAGPDGNIVGMKFNSNLLEKTLH